MSIDTYILLNNRLGLGRVSVQAIDPNLMSEISSSDACDGVSLPYCGSLSDPLSRDEVIWYLTWQFHPRKWWQHSLVQWLLFGNPLARMCITFWKTIMSLCWIYKFGSKRKKKRRGLVHAMLHDGPQKQVCKWLNVYVQYWYLTSVNCGESYQAIWAPKMHCRWSSALWTSYHIVGQLTMQHIAKQS